MPFKSTRPVLKVLSKSFQTPLVHRIDVQGKVSVNTSVQLHVTCDRAQLLAALCHRPYILQGVIKWSCFTRKCFKNSDLVLALNTFNYHCKSAHYSPESGISDWSDYLFIARNMVNGAPDPQNKRTSMSSCNHSFSLNSPQAVGWESKGSHCPQTGNQPSPSKTRFYQYKLFHIGFLRFRAFDSHNFMGRLQLLPPCSPISFLPLPFSSPLCPTDEKPSSQAEPAIFFQNSKANITPAKFKKVTRNILGWDPWLVKYLDRGDSWSLPNSQPCNIQEKKSFTCAQITVTLCCCDVRSWAMEICESSRERSH